MATPPIIGISQGELIDIVWQTITEFLSTTADPVARASIAADAPSAAPTEAAELFWRHVEARSRTLSEAAERSGDETTPVVMIVDEGVGMTVVELLEHVGLFAHDRERFTGLVEALMPNERFHQHLSTCAKLQKRK